MRRGAGGPRIEHENCGGRLRQSMSKSEGVAAVVPTSKAPIGSKGAEEKKEEPLKRRHGKETRESSGNGRGSSQDSAPACDRIALDESCKRSS
ncbi:hypothetical protein Y1Q_0014356 [Alligator mississippiensis]|uniref:Uncharacterized protein n=1 Tax=Alligator mississippiensis TaxID=8496 RepID=A0A151N212_ALLMI|nr:hypothetical protein Y1Q_0014356 [Alligator mississippiensis]